MKIVKQLLLRPVILFCVLLMHPFAYAQITLPGGTVLGGPESTTLKICEVHACFKGAGAKAQYEVQNNCKFLAKGLCGDKPFDDAKRCCGKDAKTGSAKVKDRQITQFDSSFDWATYQKECPDMRQSEAPPDGIWQQCFVGQKHSPSDHWPVKEVIQNPVIPNARKYCVDGCSTPPGAVTAAYAVEIFLVEDKDNPTGHPNSSFYGACKAHDLCYQSCDTRNQLDCDSKLRSDSFGVCNTIPKQHTTTITTMGISHDVNTRAKCIGASNRMFNILSDLNFGAKAFKTRRQQMCQCC